jgi:hypothetical protein
MSTTRGRQTWAIRFLSILVLFLRVALQAQTPLFSDDFSRDTDPGPLSPWIAHSGAWTVTGGSAAGSGLSSYVYSCAYVTNNWTNYMVQARVRFSSDQGFGGGIGGRLSPCCGSRYSVWLNPSGGPGGTAKMELIKFQTWETYAYTNSPYQSLQTATLPALGTTWHLFQVAFQENHVTAFCDSNLVLNVSDLETDPYGSGGISLDMWTDSLSYSFLVDDLVVSELPPTLAALDRTFSMTTGGSLTVTNPGLMSSVTYGASTNVFVLPVSFPAQGSLTLNTNGTFTYTPPGDFVGLDSFTYAASDGIITSAPAIVTIDVAPPTNVFYDDFSRTGPLDPLAPWVVGLGEWSVHDGAIHGTSWIQDYFSDAYVPMELTNYSVQATFHLPINGWACGLSGRLNPCTGARYVANVYPEGSGLGPGSSLRLIKFHSWLTWSPTFTAMALVSLPGVGSTNHTLRMEFSGNHIDVYYDEARVVHAIDDNYDQTPYFASGAFGVHMFLYAASYEAVFDDVSVSLLPPSNLSPLLPVQTNRTLSTLSSLVVTNTATDPDLPPNRLTYSLLAAPNGATIDTNGVITWIPTLAQSPSTNVFTTIVTDDGVPPLSATNDFAVVVSGPFDGIDLTTPSQALADPDGDGIPNLMEFALGNDPRTSADSNNGTKTLVAQDSNGRFLSLQFKRRKNTGGLALQYLPEVSGDRQTWYSDSSHALETSVTPLDAQFDWVTVKDLTPFTSAATRFIRLRIVEN